MMFVYYIITICVPSILHYYIVFIKNFNPMKKDSKQRLFEVMGRLDKTFKPTLNEWNFDKKKGEDSESEEKEEKKETSGKKKWNFEKKEGKESMEHEESESHEEEEEEHEDKKELDEAKPKSKIPVNMIAKVGGK
jgi:hypothetical protein